MKPADAIKLIEDFAAKLGEHFDHVQILATWPDENGEGSRSLYRGTGNWFARQGMAHDFIAMDQAETQAREIGRVIEPPSEGEDWKKSKTP
jgi:hypothetical protein